MVPKLRRAQILVPGGPNLTPEGGQVGPNLTQPEVGNGQKSRYPDRRSDLDPQNGPKTPKVDPKGATFASPHRLLPPGKGAGTGLKPGPGGSICPKLAKMARFDPKTDPFGGQDLG